MQFSRAYANVSGGVDKAPPGTPIPYVGSTRGVKRDNMDLDPQRWMFDNYHRSGGPLGGPWLWAHDVQRPPIAAARASVDTSNRGPQLTMAVHYDQEDPFAVAIESKVRRGYIGACSVSWDFCQRDGSRIGFGRGGKPPSYMTANAYMDLTEASNVPVGMDPDALVQRSLRSLGLVLGKPFGGYLADYNEPDSDVTAEQLIPEVLAEFERRGIDLTAAVAQWSESQYQRGAVPTHVMPKADMDMGWDADAEVARADGAEALKRMHAWQDYDGDEDAASSWKLPHHNADGQVVWHGVHAAMGRLDQTDIPDEDKPAVMAHLAGHYRQFGQPVPSMRIADGLHTRADTDALTRGGTPEDHTPPGVDTKAAGNLLAALDFRGATA